MFLLKNVPYLGDPLAAVKAACRAHYDETGRVPNSIQIGNASILSTQQVIVWLGKPPMMHRIPVEIRRAPDFGVNEVALDISFGEQE